MPWGKCGALKEAAGEELRSLRPIRIPVTPQRPEEFTRV